MTRQLVYDNFNDKNPIFRGVLKLPFSISKTVILGHPNFEPKTTTRHKT